MGSHKKQKKEQWMFKLPQLYWLPAVFAFLLYINTIPNQYNLDDELVTRGHALTSQGLSALYEIFTTPYYADASGNVYEYRPLVLASFAIEHQFFGENPHAGHFINALLYALLIFLIFRTLHRLFYQYHILLPLSVVLLFAAHPIHTEVVASLKNRDEILALLFGFLSLNYCLTYVKKDKWLFLITGVFFFLLALLTKRSLLPFAVIIPLSLSLFEKPSARQLLMLTLPLSAIAAVLTHFYYINTRLIFAFSIMAIPFAVRVFVNIESVKEIKGFFNNIFKPPLADKSQNLLPVKYLQTFDVSVLAITTAACIILMFYNSRSFFMVLLLVNVFVYLMSWHRQSQYLLISMILPAIFMSVLFNMVAGLFLSVSFFLLIFDKKSKFHWGLAVSIFALHLIFFSFLALNIFNLFIIALPISFFYFKKNFRISKIISIVFIGFFLYSTFIFRQGSINNNVVFLVFNLMVLLWVFYTYDNYKYGKKAFIILLFFVFVFVPMEFVAFKQHLNPVANFEAANIEQTGELFPVAGRALDFAEMPVNETTSLGVRIGTSFVALAFYIKLLVWPHPLGFYYGYNMLPVVNISSAWALIALFLHIVIGIAAIWLLRKNRLLAFGILFYLLSVSVFSNIVAPVAGLIGERLVFTASLGYCIVLAVLLFKLFKINYADKNKKLHVPKLFTYVLSAIILLYSIKTLSRNKDWYDHLTLFEKDILYLQQSAQAHNLLANAMIEEIQRERNGAKQKMMINKAIAHYKSALNIYPDFYNAAFSLGKTHYMATQYEEALDAFTNTARIDTSEHMLYMYKALSLENLNRMPEAVIAYEKSISIAPYFSDAYINLSALHIKAGVEEKAIATHKRYIALVPDAYENILNVGRIYFSIGDLENALHYFEQAFKINGSDKMLINALYEINLQLGNNEETEYYYGLL